MRIVLEPDGDPKPIIYNDAPEHIDDDYDSPFEPEANTPDGLIPNSWVGDDGTRHAVIWTTGLPIYMRLKQVNGKWKLINDAPF